METTLLFVLLLLQLIIVILIVIFLVRLNKDSEIFKSFSQNFLDNFRNEFRSFREETVLSSQALREEISKSQNGNIKTIISAIGYIGKNQGETLRSVINEIKNLSSSNEARLENLRNTVDIKLKQLQDSNENRLDEMRKTVDEKLHDTLEKRLGESFQLVSKQLEAVQSGLGEMRNLATGVGDLKKVLSNVKTRGVFGEAQLGAILEEILTNDQYEKNVHVKEGSRESVEYAIRLPGPGDSRDEPVYLPIDSKFPQEDYQRLVDATNDGNTEDIKNCRISLTRTIKNNAKDIQNKYLNPPKTTDFALMFLPTEGLYAEALQFPGLVDELLREYHIVVAGPTTLAAILSSLRMGFKTLAIEKRSSEVWKILGAVKTEFRKYGDILIKLKNQLDTASRTVDETGKRTKVMERKLKEVEQLPETESLELLQLTDGTMNEDDIMN